MAISHRFLWITYVTSWMAGIHEHAHQKHRFRLATLAPEYGAWDFAGMCVPFFISSFDIDRNSFCIYLSRCTQHGAYIWQGSSCSLIRCHLKSCGWSVFRGCALRQECCAFYLEPLTCKFVYVNPALVPLLSWVLFPNIFIRILSILFMIDVAVSITWEI